MSRETTRRRFLAGGAAAALTSTAGCTGLTPFVGQRIESTESVSVDDVDVVAVETSRGSVTVRTADREDVHIDIVKQSSSVTADVTDLQFRTERQDGRLRLFSEYTGREPLFGGRPSMDLDVVLPESVALEAVDTATGSIDIADTTGDLSVTASTGSVGVRAVDGDVEAETSTGSIDLQDVDGTAAASATTGSVDVRNPARLGDVTTTTGSIDVEVPAMDGDVSVEATTGSVTAALASDLDAELEVTTTTGSISVGNVGLEGGRRGDDRVTGTLGDGGPRLTVETSNGSVTLERLN
jgi:DUF4097 and DUF4098 domain-containing protein YvlB